MSPRISLSGSPSLWSTVCALKSSVLPAATKTSTALGLRRPHPHCTTVHRRPERPGGGGGRSSGSSCRANKNDPPPRSLACVISVVVVVAATIEPPSLHNSRLAREIFHQVHRRECPPPYIHAISNGRFFVWESIRHMLQSPAGGTRQNWASLSSSKGSNKEDDNHHCESPRMESSSSLPNLAWLQRLRQSLAGMFFDNCPIAELDRLGDALEHCSLMERSQTASDGGSTCTWRDCGRILRSPRSGIVYRLDGGGSEKGVGP